MNALPEKNLDCCDQDHDAIAERATVLQQILCDGIPLFEAVSEQEFVSLLRRLSEVFEAKHLCSILFSVSGDTAQNIRMLQEAGFSRIDVVNALFQKENSLFAIKALMKSNWV